MIFKLTLYAIGLLVAWLIGIHCGHKGILVDSRLDRLKRREAGLISELSTLRGVTEGYGYMMVLRKMGRSPGEVARELSECRAGIVRLGGQPKPLKNEIMEIMIQTANQKKGRT